MMKRSRRKKKKERDHSFYQVSFFFLFPSTSSHHGSMPLHMILHTGKKIECPMCGKLFQHKGVLNKHIRTIHDEKKSKEKEKRKRPGKKSGQRAEGGKDMIPQQQPLQTIQVQLEGTEGGHSVRVSLPGELVGQVGQQGEGLAVVQA